MGRLDTRYSPVRRSPSTEASFRHAAPRLACVKPVASVHPEPGSNSPLYKFLRNFYELPSALGKESKLSLHSFLGTLYSFSVVCSVFKLKNHSVDLKRIDVKLFFTQNISYKKVCLASCTTTFCLCKFCQISHAFFQKRVQR